MLLVVGAAYLLHKGRGLGFFYDDWSYIEYRRGGLEDILRAANSQIQVVPFAVYRLLFATVGVGSYLPYRLVTLAVHLGTVSAIFLYGRRRAGDLPALLVAAVILFLGPAWQEILWPAAFGFVGSVGAGVLALLVLDRQDRRGDLGASALLVLAVAMSTYGLAFVAGTAVRLLSSRADRSRWWIFVVPIVLYALWWVGWQDGQTAILDHLTRTPPFMAESAAGSAGAAVGLTPDWGRSILLLATLGLGYRIRVAGRLDPRLAGLVTAALVYWALIGVGRAGEVQPTASRYLYAGTALLLLIALEAVGRRSYGWGARALLVAGGGLAVASNLPALTSGARFLRGATDMIQAELGALNLAGTRAPAAFAPDSHLAPSVTAGPYAAAVHALGSPADSPVEIARRPEGARVAADGVLTRALGLALTPTHIAFAAAPRHPAVDGAGGGVTTVRGGCLRFVPAASGVPAVLDLRIAPGDGLGLRAGAGRGGRIEVRVRRFASDFGTTPLGSLTSGQSTLRLPPDSAAGTPWRVRLSPARPVTVCRLA